MTGSPYGRLIVGMTIAAVLFWSLSMGLVYAVMASTDDLWRLVNGIVVIPPDLAHWLQVIGMWLAQFGGWLLLIVWAMGLVVVLLLSLFARSITDLIRKQP